MSTSQEEQFENSHVENPYGGKVGNMSPADNVLQNTLEGSGSIPFNMISAIE